jgi:hypothetical protein
MHDFGPDAVFKRFVERGSTATECRADERPLRSPDQRANASFRRSRAPDE